VFSQLLLDCWLLLLLFKHFCYKQQKTKTKKLLMTIKTKQNTTQIDGNELWKYSNIFWGVFFQCVFSLVIECFTLINVFIVFFIIFVICENKQDIRLKKTVSFWCKVTSIQYFWYFERKQSVRDFGVFKFSSRNSRFLIFQNWNLRKRERRHPR
jgi:hypothetical protein